MSEFKPIIFSDEELQKRQECNWLKGCKLINNSVRTEANKQIMINREGKVIGGKPSPNDETPGIFIDKANGYTYIRLHDKGMIALQVAMKYVFYNEIECVYDEPSVDDVVDHINGIKSDNRLSNLRIVSKQFNSHNHERCKDNINQLPPDAKLSTNNETKLKCYADDEHYYIELRSNLYYKTSKTSKLPKWITRTRN